MSVLPAEYIKPCCKRSGTLEAKSSIHTEFCSHSCRRWELASRGRSVTLRKGSIGTHWSGIRSPMGLNARSGYRGHSLYGQPVGVGLMARGTVSHNGKADFSSLGEISNPSNYMIMNCAEKQK